MRQFACGDWCEITAEPAGHTEQNQTRTVAEVVSCTEHSCTACDEIWATDVTLPEQTQ